MKLLRALLRLFRRKKETPAPGTIVHIASTMDYDLGGGS